MLKWVNCWNYILLYRFFGLVSATGLTLSIIGYTNATNQKSKTFSIVGMIFSGIELILKFIQLVNIISAGY